MGTKGTWYQNMEDLTWTNKITCPSVHQSSYHARSKIHQYLSLYLQLIDWGSAPKYCSGFPQVYNEGYTSGWDSI